MHSITLVIGCLLLVVSIDAFDCGIFVSIEFLSWLGRRPRTLIACHRDTSIDILSHPIAEVGVA